MINAVQGLNAGVTVLDAELRSIDRDHQSFTTCDKRNVPYGVLVLTMGLQSPNNLSSPPGLRGPFVTPVQELLKSRPQVTDLPTIDCTCQASAAVGCITALCIRKRIVTE